MSNKLSIHFAAALATVCVLFSLSSTRAGAQTEKVLHNFNVSSKPGGSGPQGSMVMDSAGDLYGTTFYGGSGSGDDCSDGSLFGCGTAFELVRNPHGGFAEKVLHNFGNSGDGANPAAGLISDASGNLYGTTSGGGVYGCGTVFELSPNKSRTVWTETILHNFCQPGSVVDGSWAQGGLTFDAAGNLYGTTAEGGLGQCSCGIAYELTPQGDGIWAEKVLFNFGDPMGGSNPIAGVILDASGNIYGTTGNGGSDCNFGAGCGVVFELMPAESGTWTEKLLYIFTEGDENPNSALVMDKTGNLYGATLYGPGVFELSPNADGTWTKKDINVSCCFPNNLTLHNGDIYVTYGANTGGSCCGSLSELVPNRNGTWTEKTLYRFGNGKTGAYPASSLVFDSNGNIYGSTAQGGAFWQVNSGEYTGTVFEITPARHQFTTGSPRYPVGGLLGETARE